MPFHAKTSSHRNLYAVIKKDGTLGWAPRAKAAEFKDEADALARIGAAAQATAKLGTALGESEAFIDEEDDGSLTFRRSKLRAGFVLEPSKIALLGLREGFDLFYVKGEGGWLAHARSRNSYGSFDWSDHFGDAKPFPSAERAKAAAYELCEGEGEVAILRASSVFTQVDIPASLASDDGLAGLRSAIEAHDIRSGLQRAVQERSKAEEAAAPKTMRGRI